MNVSDVYTRGVVATLRSSNLHDAAILMRDFHVGSLIVTDDDPLAGRAVGIVTDRDIVVQALASGADPNEMLVTAVMTPQVEGIAETADRHKALHKMRSLGVRRLAVRGTGGAVVGILAFDDVVDALAVEVGRIADVIRTEREHEVEDVEEIGTAQDTIGMGSA